MIPLDLTLNDGILYGGLGFSTLAFGWLALRGWRFPGVAVPDGIAASREILGTMRNRHRLPRGLDADRMGEGFRLPTTMPDDARHPIPGGIRTAFDLLLVALDSPEVMPAPAARVIAAARSGRPVPQDALRLARRRVGQGEDDVLTNHAWWETAIVEMVERCRAAGSWIAPVHLDPFLMDRPEIRAAIRASAGWTVAPEGAGILAHWQAERALGFRIREPRLDAARAALARAAA